MVDLSELNGDEPPRLVDTSGKPLPKNIRAILDSSIEIPCAIKYDGMSGDLRKYLVIAEVDWYRHWVKVLIVGEWPSDVHLVLCTGKEVDPARWLASEFHKYKSQMEVVIEKRIPV